jgi:cytochrome c
MNKRSWRKQLFQFNITSSKTDMFRKKNALLIGCLLLPAFYLISCESKPEQSSARTPVDYIKQIPGIDDSIPAGLAEKGEALISYADCYTCHKEDQRSVGPAFRDIAKRYPINKVYIEMLAHKVIIGGGGSWGSAVMDPHPKLSFKNAKMMVTYILSLKKKFS